VLLDHFGIERPADFVSYRQGNEERTGARLLAWLQQGRTVALCSDGGYPGISDPGYRLVALAAEHGVAIDVLPGASAVPLALIHSGLPTSSYTFKGYPPRKPGARRRFFESERELPHTLIVFESPMRVASTLRAAYAVLGDRKACVCAELTKLHQRVERGYLGELAAAFECLRVRGEVTLVIAGSHPKMARCPVGEGVAADLDPGGENGADAGEPAGDGDVGGSETHSENASAPLK
jgi:16S rRNA (cytidine1402-2'-O)-methyltransferase